MTNDPPYPSGVPLGTRRTDMTRVSSRMAGSSPSPSSESQGGTP